tara:strand:- start:577 stop:1560 length:984 start_codon:yes stop_codon:yes gene_type:complete
MSNLNSNGTFNHQKWQRTINEGPGDDPMLKSLRTRIPGEKFPELKTWWEYQPEDIMTYVYWHQGQLPPTGTQFDKEWINIVKQLHSKHPIPADVLPSVDLDRDAMDAIMQDAPRAESVDRATMTEALARGLKPLLMIGSTIKSNVGEDALVKLSDKFEDIDDEQADDIASHLNMGIELMQDRSPSEARGWFKKFNNACKDALKGKPTKSAFENNDPAVRFKKLAGITEAGGTGVFEPGDKYSNDFDYTGMLRWGADANVETMDISELNAGYDSFTDVNYHTEAADLGNAIEWMEDNPVTNEDHSKIEDFMSSFNSACAKALGEIDRN